MKGQLQSVRFRTVVTLAAPPGKRLRKKINSNLFTVGGGATAPGGCESIKVTDDGWVVISGHNAGDDVPPILARAEQVVWALPLDEPPQRSRRTAKDGE
jgi:hypothetical protein